MAKNSVKTGLSQLGNRTAEPPISWLMKTALDHPGIISLAAGFTDNATLPVKEARKLFKEILGDMKSGQAALQYGSTAGDAELRRLTVENLRQADCATGKQAGCYNSANLLISHGSQQLLYMVTEALCDPGDIVLVEDPTYFVYLGIMQSHGLNCRTIRMEDDGINLDHLKDILRELERTGAISKLKLLYLVSYYQNPTGTTTSFAKKAQILKLLRQYEKAAGHRVYLLEDAAYRNLRFSGDDVPSFLTVDPSRVIYTSTYSKPFATGARVGYGLLPPDLIQTVLRIKGNHDFGTANLIQQLIAKAISTGVYERHVKVLQKRYAEKAGIMASAIRLHFPHDTIWNMPGGGLYIWARLPRSIQSNPKSKLFREAVKNNVLYVPGALCYADDINRAKPDHEMRLSFGGACEADMNEGIGRLGNAIKISRKDAKMDKRKRG